MTQDDVTWGDPARIALGELVFDVSVAGPADGEPVVLLHGFPQSRAAWTHVAPLLSAAGLRVIAPDQRGYSPTASPAGTENYRIDALVDDVVGLLDAIDLPTTHLVGHDWGAVVGWFVAARHPDRVRTLTTVSVPHPAAFGRALAEDAEQQESSSYMQLLRSDKAERVLLADDARRLRAMFGSALPDRFVQAHIGALTESGLTTRLNWYRAMRSDFSALQSVSVPTTFVWGADDPALRRTGAELCGQYVTGDYRFIELPDVGHWIPELHPDELTSAILQRVGVMQ